MRHRVFGQKLGRSTNARRALLASLASAVITNGQITTTVAKAKFAKPYLEKLITDARKNRMDKNRLIASLLSGQAFSRLKDVAAGFSAKSGGYTKITKLGKRRGDSTLLARLELLPLESLKKGQTPKTVKSQPLSKIKPKSQTSNDKKH